MSNTCDVVSWRQYAKATEVEGLTEEQRELLDALNALLPIEPIQTAWPTYAPHAVLDLWLGRGFSIGLITPQEQLKLLQALPALLPHRVRAVSECRTS